MNRYRAGGADLQSFDQHTTREALVVIAWQRLDRGAARIPERKPVSALHVAVDATADPGSERYFGGRRRPVARDKYRCGCGHGEQPKNHTANDSHDRLYS